MANFEAMQRDLTKIHSAKSHNEALYYILPVQGISLKDKESFKIGNVEFAGFDKIETLVDSKMIQKLKTFFNVQTFAVISTDLFPTENKHEFVLQYLKEIIGAIHLLVFKKYGLKKEKKIIISDVPTPEVEEGLVKRVLICKGDTSCWYQEYDLALKIEELKGIDLSPWKNFFDIQIQQRNEFQNIKGKSLEMIYYCINDVHAISRMQKMFVLLNFALRKDNGSFSSGYIQKYYGIIIDRILKLSPFGKFNKDFTILYNKERNNIQHGLISLDNEFSVVKAEDYNNLKTLVFYSIIYLFENRDFDDFKLMSELINYLDDINQKMIEQLAVRN